MTREVLSTFLKDVDNDFHPPLSQRVNVEDFITKVLNFAHIESENTADGDIKGIIIGYTNNKKDKYAYLTLLAVRKQFRRKGLAKSLLLRYLNYVKSLEFIKTIGLYTNNLISLEMYIKCGFNIVSENEGRYYLEISLV